MLFTLWNHDHFSLIKLNLPFSEFDSHGTLQNNEGLIIIGVIMPCELTFDFQPLELVVIHFSNDFRWSVF